jgi:hypothetical protein
MNTFYLISCTDIPRHKQKEIIYTKVVNLICCPGNTGTVTAMLDLIKLMLKIVITHKGAQFACTSTSTCQWKIPSTSASNILEYRLAGEEDQNGWIYFKIHCECCGLPQAGILANNLLSRQLEKEGYYKATTTLGLW